MIKNLTITINESDNEPGFYYDIYDCDAGEVVDEGKQSIDGGMCTGTIRDALGMATSQANYLLLQGQCDNTDHEGRAEDCRLVLMDKEFETEAGEEEEPVIWCKACRERDDDFISKVLD